MTKTSSEELHRCGAVRGLCSSPFFVPSFVVVLRRSGRSRGARLCKRKKTRPTKAMIDSDPSRDMQLQSVSLATRLDYLGESIQIAQPSGKQRRDPVWDLCFALSQKQKSDPSQGSRALIIQQTIRGSLSAVSKPMFANKYSKY